MRHEFPRSVHFTSSAVETHLQLRLPRYKQNMETQLSLNTDKSRIDDIFARFIACVSRNETVRYW